MPALRRGLNRYAECRKEEISEVCWYGAALARTRMAKSEVFNELYLSYRT